MVRREFLQKAGTFAAAAVVWPQPAGRRPDKMGLQLFTIRRPLAEELAGTLKQVAVLGYEEVETYGFDPERIGYYGPPTSGSRARPAGS